MKNSLFSIFTPWRLLPFRRKKSRLQLAFEYVRRTFFPGWDKDGQWKAKFISRSPSGGRADPNTKTITLSSLPRDTDWLYLILIHEICHATTQSGHGKRWRDRLRKAHNRAKEIGMASLAEKLLAEMDLYSESTVPGSATAANVYSCIRDFVIIAVFESRSYGYKKIIKMVARSFGLYPHELEQRFKKCRQAYDRAIKEAIETKEKLG